MHVRQLGQNAEIGARSLDLTPQLRRFGRYHFGGRYDIDRNLVWEFSILVLRIFNAMGEAR